LRNNSDFLKTRYWGF